MRIVYLDNNSTTPCDPAVVGAMTPFFCDDYGNASSPHIMGRRAAAAVAKAREEVASLVESSAEEIFFTSGATESNNLVLQGLRHQAASRRGILTCVAEHKAILSPCEQLESRGLPIVRLPVTPDGVLEMQALKNAASESTMLVSIQAANNEVGTLQPISEVVRIAHSAGALVHCDAAQALGKVPFSVTSLCVDYASFSAHKMYGPKGIGALYVRSSAAHDLQPIVLGGGQEGGVRPGTLNVPAIVGFGKACAIARERLQEDVRLLTARRDKLEADLLAAIPGGRINSAAVGRLPGTTSITLPGIPADLLIANATGVCFSNGSACTSGSVAPSHVLIAMGLSREDADCTIRLSIGRQNTEGDIQKAIRQIVSAANRVRRETRCHASRG